MYIHSYLCKVTAILLKIKPYFLSDSSGESQFQAVLAFSDNLIDHIFYDFGSLFRNLLQSGCQGKQF